MIHEKENKKYSLIIGNPPYFEINKNSYKHYNEIIYGRTNIYSLFLYKSIKLLKDDGVLIFVIPKTIMTGKYFSRIREYIYSNCCILDIVKFKNNNIFSKATQNVIVLKLRKVSSNSRKFTIRDKLNNLFFTTDQKYMLTVLNNKTININDLNCIVKTGSVSWNENKNLLDNNPDNGIPLIYSTCIKNDKLIFKNSETHKKQYMKITKENEKLIETGPFILINRIINPHNPNINIIFF